MNMVYIIIGIILIILIMPFNIRFLYDDKKSDIEINLIKIFNIKIDVDKFIRFLLTSKKDRSRITVDSIMYKMGLFLKSKHITKWIIKRTRLVKSSILIEEDIEKYLTFIASWITINSVKKYIEKMFYKVENNYYMVLPSNKRKISMEFIMQTRIILGIIAILINIKDVFKMIKFMRVYYGKSNI